MSDHQLYIGLMSGTSADGIDAVLVDLQAKPELIATYSLAFPHQLREQIHAISIPGNNEIDRMGALDVILGKRFAQCCLALLDKSGISPSQVVAVGSHGQTIRHRPPGSSVGCFTLQIGDPSQIAELTGITTVADFRRRDMAAGGQGAPLVPAFHRALFHSPGHNKAVVNIGGMANITWLPAGGDVFGFDTGPGNALMDSWINEHSGEHYDKDGHWAASGLVVTELLLTLLADPFFSLPFPKSTGREHFNKQWLDHHLQQLASPPAKQDVQATLLELTARSIANSIESLSKAAQEVLVCGGGAFNTKLLGRLGELLPHCRVTTTASQGINPQWIEAMAFAWLAQQTIERKPGNLSAATGANREVILGGVYYA